MSKNFLSNCRLLPISLFGIVLSLLSAGQADAQIFWYNGDNNGSDSFLSSDSTAATPYSGIVYDDFTVSAGSSANITGIFGNFLFASSTTGSFISNAVIGNANWEIRTGVSAGTAGTPVASGTGATTVTTSLTPSGHTLYDITVSGLSLNLPGGTTYWVGLQPVTTSAAYGDLVTTGGINATGTPQGNDGNAFFSDNFGHSYAAATTGPTHDDFSLGVVGTSVPEPATWLLTIVGLGLVVLFRSRSKQA